MEVKYFVTLHVIAFHIPRLISLAERVEELRLQIFEVHSDVVECLKFKVVSTTMSAESNYPKCFRQQVTASHQKQAKKFCGLLLRNKPDKRHCAKAISIGDYGNVNILERFVLKSHIG